MNIWKKAGALLLAFSMLTGTSNITAFAEGEPDEAVEETIENEAEKEETTAEKEQETEVQIEEVETETPEETEEESNLKEPEQTEKEEIEPTESVEPEASPEEEPEDPIEEEAEPFTGAAAPMFTAATNDTESGKIKISKTITGLQNGDALSGFSITLTSGPTTVYLDMGKYSSYTDGTYEWVLDQEDLPLGTYSVRESGMDMSSKGYTLVSTGTGDDIFTIKEPSVVVDESSIQRIEQQNIKSFTADRNTFFAISINGPKISAWYEVWTENRLTDDEKRAVCEALRSAKGAFNKIEYGKNVDFITGYGEKEFYVDTIGYAGEVNISKNDDQVEFKLYKTSRWNMLAVGKAEYQYEKIPPITISNSYTPETIDLTVTKVWDDKDDQDGKRAGYTVQLYADGKAVSGKSATNDKDTLETKWEGLPKYKDGKEIVYSVAETGVPADYTSSAPEGKAVGFTNGKASISNSYEPETVDLTVTKIWDDKDNQDGKRSSYTVQLYADGAAVSDKVESKAKDDLTTEWKDLPKYKNGVEIVYSVAETGVPADYTSSAPEGKAVEFTDGKASISNSYEPETIDLTVTKIWEDENDQDGKRDRYTVQLYADGEAVSDKVESKAKDDLTTEWKDLPKYKNGQEITYTVVESVVPEGYESTATADSPATFTNGEAKITNSYTPKTIDVKVTKKWDDQNDKDKVRPAQITVKLYENGVEKETVIISERDGWKYTFEELPAMKDGQKITYSVSESAVSNYSTNVSGNAENGFTIVNKHTINEKKDTTGGTSSKPVPVPVKPAVPNTSVND